MSRPKKGTKAGEIATSKWRETMFKNHGGKEGLHKMMSKVGAIGGKNGHTGGFASDHERARIAGAKGGSISKRDEAKTWYEKNKHEIEYMRQDGFTIREIGSVLGCSQQKIYYVLNKYGRK